MKKATGTILIIEDEKPLLRVLHDKFSQEGFAVLEAADGVEGLEAALKNHPDLILLDLIMPKLDGVNMLRKLREDAWGKTVPVIALTNLSSLDAISESVAKGVRHYLVKTDWTLEDVLKQVRGVLKIK